MNNVNVDHFLDEVPSSGLKNLGEPDQFLVTSPPSEVKSSDLNIRRMVDSDTAAEKDSNEKTNVDELQSSGLKYSVGEPDQFLVTSPLSEVKSSDLNIHHMVYSGTSGGNADVNEVKSASSQQLSRGQEESQMKLQGEKSEDNVRSVYLEEYKQMSFIKEKIEENQELYHATAADLNVHHMVDSGTASGHVDACEVISESLQTTSQGLEMSTMKLTPERNDNVRPFYVEENMQMSVNFLEQFGNYMMMREDSDRTPVQFLPTSDLNIHKVAVKDVCEVKSASSQQMKFPSERSDYNVGSFNLEENKQMSGDKAQIEDNRELYAATPSDPNVHLMVDSDTVAEKDSNGKTNVFPNVDEVPSSGLKYLVGEPDQVLTTTPLSKVKSSDHNIHHMGDSGTVAGNADACEVKSASLQQTSQAQEEPKMKLQCERSENIVGSFYLEENMQMSDNKEHIEDNQELSPATPTDLDVLHMVDPGTAAGHADGCEVNFASSQGREEAKMKPTPERSDDVGTFYVEENMYMSVNTVAEPEDENEPFTANTKRKRSDVVDTNSDEEVKAGELVHSVSQSSEMMSCNFSLQQLFASDTCEEEMLNLSEKEKTCMVADLEACIGFPPNDLEAATTKGSEDDKYFDPTILRNVVTETCRIDKVEKENNQEDCFSAQGEVSKLVDNSDVYDDISGVGAEAENQSHMTSRKRKSSDEDDTSANSDEDVKADELVPTVPQPSEMELCNFSLQQLFASDTASSEEVAYKTNLDSPSKATPVASGEKSMIFSPKLEMSLPQKHERDNSIEMSLPQKRERDNSIGTCDMKENINIDKKEEVGSMMSKTKFAKRQPLQDLQQN